MKKFSIILCLFISFLNYGQIDSLNYKKERKENRFKVAGRVIKNSVITIPGDFGEMGHSISKDWKTSVFYAVGILGLIATDHYTTTFLHETIEPAIDYTLPDITIGKNNNFPWLSGEDAYIAYPLIGLYAGSFIVNNEKGQRAAANAIKSMAYSFVITHLALKAIMGRNRPHRSLADNEPVEYPFTRDNWDFFNAKGVHGGVTALGTAMPSLHATAYYAVAKVIQMEYDNYWIPYGFVTLVFMANMKDHNHWVSDMLVGGLIGTVIGRSVVLSSRKQIEKDKNKLALKKSSNKLEFRKQLIPQISSSFLGLQFVASF
ncbi:phosphatase PAP2 family protein [Flavicella sp.]|uniref:phosphatase PAP2 family protein n=1 Tax=Flavicella sp. TaxID=2957742 RepID=UPI00260CA46D|nr:phosphatase PAP2 family protein [Flavicella sp.]MDG1805065.1 phosphatase PAP2 family protein [Flavicella sp.]MDG2279131.1 phosphatase PAP2 family protein [Flavicella sp.]